MSAIESSERSSHIVCSDQEAAADLSVAANMLPISVAANMLRRQHEAIKVLREALTVLQSKAGGTSTLAYRVAEKALKDTENLA